MSWLDTLHELVAISNVGGVASSYLRGQIITQAVRAGASANSILNALTANGLGIRRAQGLVMVSQEAARQAAGVGTNAIDLTSSMADLLGTTPPAGWTGQFVHQVTAVYRTRDEEGNYILHTRTLGIKSSLLLSPADAINAAQQIMTSSIPTEEEGDYPLPSDVLSMSLTGVWWDVQGRSLPQTPGIRT